MITPRLLTIREARAYLGGISENHLRYTVEGDGRVHRVSLGRRVFYDRIELDAYIDRQRARGCVASERYQGVA